MKTALFTIMFLITCFGLQAQGVSIQVNPQYFLEGTISSKSGKKMAKVPISIYGYDRVWIITTNEKGYYRIDFSSTAKHTPPPVDMDGNNNVLFYYSDKRYIIVPTQDFKFEENDVDGMPVAYYDVRL